MYHGTLTMYHGTNVPWYIDNVPWYITNVPWYIFLWESSVVEDLNLCPLQSF